VKIIITYGPVHGSSTQAHWDTMEWDDKTIQTDSSARGLFARMVAQSIQEWAEKRDMEERHAKSRLQREAAKEEVDVERQRLLEPQPF
jgi:hypothetical protein